MTTHSKEKENDRTVDRRLFIGLLGGVGTGVAALAALKVLDPTAGPSSFGAGTTASASTTGAAGTSQTDTGTTPDLASSVEITIEGSDRIIRSNGIPAHPLDPDYSYRFGVSEQNYEWRLPLEPEVAESLTECVTGQKFGVSIDGVPYDPATAGFWNDDRSSGWLQDAHMFPLDVYGAHVQQGGVYHYHEYPEAWDIVSEMDGTTHGVQVGWAADGFPVYVTYGYETADDPGGSIVELHSSWRLRSGERSSDAPEGSYDGTWVQDYEYVEGLGELDECNGRSCVTPDFPDGTYAYFITRQWPFVPRWIRGVVSDSFTPGRPGGGART